MRIDLTTAPPPRWWLRSAAWLAASWVCALAALALLLAEALARPAPGRALGGAVAWVALEAGWYFGALFGCVALALLPVLLGWGALGPALGRADRTWAGVAAGTALVAALAARIGWGTFGVPGAGAAGPLGAWLVAWAGLLLPRVLVRGLRPGAFAGPARPDA